MRLFRLGRKPSSKFYCWQQLVCTFNHDPDPELLEPCAGFIIHDLSSGALALHALASSSLMPSALPFLEPCAFIPLINPAEHYNSSAICARAFRARALSHDFTMATHSEHAHFITKWRIRYAQLLSMNRTHPLLRNYQDNAKLACHCTAHY